MGTIYLVRHGQASFAAEDYDALSELGVRQATVLGEKLRGRRFEHVVCGSMKRHAQTAAACLGVATTIDPGWNEFDHRAVIAAHQTDEQGFEAVFLAAVKRWIAGGTAGDETFVAFRARTLDAMTRLAARVGKGESAIVFTSGGPISAVCSELLSVPLQRSLDVQWTLVNCGVSKLLTRGGEITVSSINEHAWFERELITYR